jgi:small-conductance mechanosensitive channel
MKRLFRNMNPTLRGFLIIAAIVVIVMVLNLYGTLVALGILLRIAFFLAIAFFVYLMWRDRRGEIGTWDRREQVVLYGSALLIVAAVGTYFWHGFPGYDLLGFIGVIACAGFAIFRVWRGRHTYT